MKEMDFFNRPYCKLNERQRKAVTAADRNILLLAVPGSGKTEALIFRLGYLVQCRGVLPENVLAVSYTVAATKQLRSRFAVRFGSEIADRIEFRTVNGLSAKIIRLYEIRRNRKAFELVTDEGILNHLTAELYRKVTGELPTDGEILSVRGKITYAKNRQATTEELEQIGREIKGFPEIYRQYRERMNKDGKMDYDDQMIYAFSVLCRCPEILNELQNTFRHILVDEAQDCSVIQFKILRLLAGEKGNLFLVGDEDQSIYGFRAADPRQLYEYAQEANVLYLNENYRSAKEIVNASAAFIKRNTLRHEKNMQAVRKENGTVREIRLQSRSEQYTYLKEIIETNREGGAVLYRDNESALPLIDTLERNGIPFCLRKMDLSFFTSRTVRDVTDFFTLAERPSHGEAFLRVYYKLNARIRKELAEACAAQGGRKSMWRRAAESGTLTGKTAQRCRELSYAFERLRYDSAENSLRRIFDEMGYGEYRRRNDIEPGKWEILTEISKNVPDLRALLQRMDELKTIVGEGRGEQAPWLLSTIHGAKGAEFSSVYLMDVVNDVLPCRPRASCSDIFALTEEERRLFYVGMTRAKDFLGIFTFQKEGMESDFSDIVFGREQKNDPKGRKEGSSAIKTAKNYQDYTVGLRVTHTVFGPGVIVKVRDRIVTVCFDGGSVKDIWLTENVCKNVMLPEK